MRKALKAKRRLKMRNKSTSIKGKNSTNLAAKKTLEKYKENVAKNDQWFNEYYTRSRGVKIPRLKIFSQSPYNWYRL